MPKVLLCGAVQGHWGFLFERIRKLNAVAKDHPFEVLMCIGRCFPLPGKYLTGGGKQTPLPTYCLPAHETARSWQEDAKQTEIFDRLKSVDHPSDPVKVGEDFYCLAGAGVATIAGLKVAYVSGTETLGQGDEKGTLMTYTKASVMALMHRLLASNDYGNVDFLLTADYPTGFQLLLPKQPFSTDLRECQALTKLVQHVHPRYHITSGGDVFYQRLPYVTEVSGTKRKQLTRLIGLSGVQTGKAKFRKYLHALQVVPCMQQSANERQHVDIPSGTTQNPYLHAKVDKINRTECEAKRRKIDVPATRNLSAKQIEQLTAKSLSDAQFFYDQRLAAKGLRKGGLLPDGKIGQQGTNNRLPVGDRTECWFCLSTPTLERHLIVSIGQDAYLALPKGGICGDHVLIVPIAHEASTLKLSDDTWREMERFKAALRRYFASQNKEILVLDRNVATLGATHCHWQVVGVPKDKADAARRIFETEGEKYHVKFHELLQNSESTATAVTTGPLELLRQQTCGKSFLYVELPDGQNGSTKLLHQVEGKHYIQFGRYAAACLLEMPRRANWKFCVVSKPEEEKLAQTFKSQWKPYDFTLEDEANFEK